MSSIQEALSGALRATGGTPPGRNRPEALNLTVHPQGVAVTAANPKEIAHRIQRTETFYLDLRRRVRLLLQDEGWNIRYAAQVDQMLFLHNSAVKQILFDPLAPFRSPIRALAAGETLVLFQAPSFPYYFKPKSEMNFKTRGLEGIGSIVTASSEVPHD